MKTLPESPIIMLTLSVETRQSKAAKGITSIEWKFLQPRLVASLQLEGTE